MPLRVFLDSKVLPPGNSVIALGLATWAKHCDDTQQVHIGTKAVVASVTQEDLDNIPRKLATTDSEGWLERRREEIV